MASTPEQCDSASSSLKGSLNWMLLSPSQTPPAIERAVPADGARASVMLAVGTPGPEFDVELIEATAELPDEPATSVIPEGFGAKYRELLHRAGLTVQRFAEVYSQPIVLRPTRFLDYGGHGWDRGPAFAT